MKAREYMRALSCNTMDHQKGTVEKFSTYFESSLTLHLSAFLLANIKSRVSRIAAKSIAKRSSGETSWKKSLSLGTTMRVKQSYQTECIKLSFGLPTEILSALQHLTKSLKRMKGWTASCHMRRIQSWWLQVVVVVVSESFILVTK